ncbi:sigma-70 family RNA polymerase sigma factor [Calycomorphotria hydatis]|uniref:RNA polymerase sigma factor n=1 Tax=Calycomorphotria hydatis TaxID=2528027 RepID=A0A517TE77_9PLAN|nr:sigma-70 family RNA polymerase sigma factor [Calycomorphotria hydatis]QDT66674.1 RNA polymerase sigma factor [Calycomorphotria hydatis]
MPTESVNERRRDEFLDLFHDSRDELRSYLGALIINVSDADDVFQELSLILWKRFDRFEAGTNFFAWARTIALNSARVYWRKQVGRRNVELANRVVEKLSRAHRGQVEVLDMQREKLKACVEQLGERDRQFITKVYEAGVTVKQLAKQLGRNPDELYKRLSRLRQRLRTCANRGDHD